MPSFPIVDTHLHIWDLGRLRYPWLPNVPKINRSHLIDEYRSACGPVAVAKMVFLQCECDPVQFQEEADWVTEVARADPRIRGVVPWAPLEKGDGAEAELARLASNPLVKGIRINHLQLANTLKLVRQCPNVSFILDHIGKPDIKGRVLDPWRAELRELASHPNVSCKLSGLANEADMEKWAPADLRPYIDQVIDCFGFDRTIFGGDWPVATLATDYPRWIRTVDDALAGCSADEMHRLYVRNAEAFYRV